MKPHMQQNSHRAVDNTNSVFVTGKALTLAFIILPGFFICDAVAAMHE